MYQTLHQIVEALQQLDKWPLESMVGKTSKRMTNEEKVLAGLNLGHIRSDILLARHIYGSSGRIDSRYRKLVTRIQLKLELELLGAALPDSLPSRTYKHLTVVRSAVLGQMLIRLRASSGARRHLLNSVYKCTTPEMLWFAIASLDVLAFDAASNGSRKQVEQLTALKDTFIESASIISEINDIRNRIIAATRKSRRDATVLAPVVTKARKLLGASRTTDVSPFVQIAASRLAATVAQVQSDIKLGLEGAAILQQACETLGSFDTAMRREYHQQRLFMFLMDGQARNALEEASQIQLLTVKGSTSWFQATEGLIALLLQSGRIRPALEACLMATSRSEFKHQPAPLQNDILFRKSICELLETTVDMNRSSRSMAARHIETVEATNEPTVLRMIYRILYRTRISDMVGLQDAISTFSRALMRSSVYGRDARLKAFRRLLSLWSRLDFDAKATAARAAGKEHLAAIQDQSLSKLSPYEVIPFHLLWKRLVAMTS